MILISAASRFCDFWMRFFEAMKIPKSRCSLEGMRIEVRLSHSESRLSIATGVAQDWWRRVIPGWTLLSRRVEFLKIFEVGGI